MFRKFALALAATAALGAASLSATGSAEAKPWGYHKHHFGHHHHWHGPRFYGYRYVNYAYGGCYVKRWVATPWGLKLRLVNRCF